MGATTGSTVRAVACALLLACGDVKGESPPAAHRAPPALRPPATRIDTVLLERAFQRGAELPRLRSLLVQWRGDIVGERYFNGATATRSVNIKSASKSVVSALVGIAIARGDLEGTEQTLASALRTEAAAIDSIRRAITIADLLSMRAGLQSTSFDNYGSWVGSRNWVRDALRRPMVSPPGHDGGPMIYSTGSSHLLSAILTQATGLSTYRYADRHLFRPLGITLRPWPTDPQGIFFGGNDMRLTPREMVAFGALYLNRGMGPGGRRVLDSAWVDSSWVPRTQSFWSGNDYGYGWWITRMRERPVYYAWGYGGQFIFVIPSLQMVVVTTSDPEVRSRGGGHLDAIVEMVANTIIPAAEQ